MTADGRADRHHRGIGQPRRRADRHHRRASRRWWVDQRHHRRADRRHRWSQVLLAALLATTATAVVTSAAGVASATSPTPLGSHLPLQRAAAAETSASPADPSTTDSSAAGTRDGALRDSADDRVAAPRWNRAARPWPGPAAGPGVDAATAGPWAGGAVSGPPAGASDGMSRAARAISAGNAWPTATSGPSTAPSDVPPSSDVARGSAPDGTPDGAPGVGPGVGTGAGPGVALPISIEIPDIDVTSELVPLGLDDDRRLEVPPSPDVAGWYAGGPRPGEDGAAVIVGHVDWTDGPAVFWPIPHLEAGDPVLVRTEADTTVEFVVDRVERWPKAEFPTDLVYGDADGAELRLVTCGGVFDDDVGSYRDNIIVFARRGSEA